MNSKVSVDSRVDSRVSSPPQTALFTSAHFNMMGPAQVAMEHFEMWLNQIQMCYECKMQLDFKDVV